MNGVSRKIFVFQVQPRRNTAEPAVSGFLALAAWRCAQEAALISFVVPCEALNAGRSLTSLS